MQENLTSVALIVLNYNTPELTISAVRKILAQKTGIRIVITDNASTDGSFEKFQCAFKESKDVFVIETGTNGGYAKGNNFGIAYAEKLDGISFIGVMNPDVEIEARDLFLIIDALKDETLGLVTGREIYNGKKIDPNPCAWRKLPLFRLVVSPTLVGGLLRRIAPKRVKTLVEKFYACETYDRAVTPVYAVHGCCFFSRLDTWKKIGGFDERTFLYWEEDILAEKVCKAGLRNAVVRDAWFRHNHQEKDRLMQEERERFFHMLCDLESRKLFLREYSHYGWCLRTFPILLWRVDYFLRKLLAPVLFRRRTKR